MLLDEMTAVHEMTMLRDEWSAAQLRNHPRTIYHESSITAQVREMFIIIEDKETLLYAVLPSLRYGCRFTLNQRFQATTAVRHPLMADDNLHISIAMKCPSKYIYIGTSSWPNSEWVHLCRPPVFLRGLCYLGERMHPSSILHLCV